MSQGFYGPVHNLASKRYPVEGDNIDTLEPGQTDPGDWYDVKTEAGPSAPPKTVCFDFDGTLAKHKTGWPLDKIGPPKMKRIRDLKKVQKAGFKVCVLTARTSEYWPRIKLWLAAMGITGVKVTNVKPPAIAYIDDRGVDPDDDVPKRVRQLATKESTRDTPGREYSFNAPVSQKHIESRIREFGVKGMHWGAGKISSKDPKTMGGAAINKEFEHLRSESSKLTDEMIAQGRGSEKPSETFKKDDPLANHMKAIFSRQSDLQAEGERRYGPSFRPGAKLGGPIKESGKETYAEWRERIGW